MTERIWDEVDRCYRDVTVLWNGSMGSLLSDHGYMQRHAPEVSTMKREKGTLPTQKEVRSAPVSAEVNPWATENQSRQRIYGNCRNCGQSKPISQLSTVKRFCGGCRLGKAKPRKVDSERWTWCKICRRRFTEAEIMKSLTRCPGGRGCQRFGEAA